MKGFNILGSQAATVLLIKTAPNHPPSGDAKAWLNLENIIAYPGQGY